MVPIHIPVLLKESINGLNLKKGAVVVDATLGGGGHSHEILKKIGDGGILIGIDVDISALKNFAEFPISNSQFPNGKSAAGNLFLIKDNFSNLKNILGGLGIKSVDAILADLGFSSDQMEDPARGFSFQKDAELDMRLDQGGELTAKRVINEYSEENLERILKDFGEEKFARRIAREIGKSRKEKEICGTKELAEIILSAIPEKFRHGKIHPATKTFQALRIEVNRELENLEKFMPEALEALNFGGRLAIITFHSLEDRIVKNIFRENARGCICPPKAPVCQCGHKPEIKIINKKPIAPGAEEIKENPRARSAKLRIAEKIHPVRSPLCF